MNGAIIVDKEENMTSRDAVNKLNYILNTKQIGHIGTLDPLATGVLVCLIGKATKLSNILTSETKEYIASFKLGLLTDTLDITGTVIDIRKPNVNSEQIKTTIMSFIGSYEQEVPIYSAVKVNGKKLYEYARNNEKIKLPTRNVNIYNIDIMKIDKDMITIKCQVSKGTYIRSLIRDIGEKLGTYAIMTSLRRTKIGNFDILNASTLDEIKNNNYKLLTIEDLLPCEIENVTDETILKHIQNGNIINKNSNYLLFKYQNNNIALYQKIKVGEMKPLIMFNH